MKPIGEMTMAEVSESEDIQHYGILGQKWGIRRFQNEDGTLTEEGKRRYGRDDGSPYDSNSNTWKRSDARYLTDQELNRRNSRLQREKQYRDMTENQVMKWIKNTANAVILVTAVTALKGQAAKLYKDKIEFGKEWLAVNKEFKKLPIRELGSLVKG